MGEKVDNRFHETLHGTRNCNSVWSNGQNGGFTSHSPDINHNSLGCNLPIMVALCDKSTSKFQEIKLPSPENISSQKTGFPIQQDDFDGIGYRGYSNHNKYNNFNKKITKEETSQTENEDDKMYVQSVSLYWEDRQDTYMARTERNGEDYIPKQQIGSGIENENSQSIKRVPFGCCPNTERVRIMQASLGKLCRDYGLDSTPWTQIPKKSCKLVLPDDIDGDSDDQTSMSQMQMNSKDDEMLEVLTDPKNSLILVEMIACESDICRVSSSIGFEIKIKVPLENLIVYIKRVKEYGFNHIIIIGELYCGMLFLDCYGRLFEWDHMQYLLFPLGDYLKKDFQINPAIAWKAAGEFVFEIKTREDLPGKHNIHPLTKKNKKKKLRTKDPITDITSDRFLLSLSNKCFQTGGVKFLIMEVLYSYL
uniref:Uncharacterized protein n=2 Tax=Rhizophagus irregularis TaxID=588596 RepID=U9SZM7_RHIID